MHPTGKIHNMDPRRASQVERIKRALKEADRPYVRAYGSEDEEYQAIEPQERIGCRGDQRAKQDEI